MTLPATGPISFNDINVELGRSPTAFISLNDPEVRELAGKPTGAISFADLRGKTAAFNLDLEFASNFIVSNANLKSLIQTYTSWDGVQKIIGTVTLNGVIHASSTASYALTVNRSDFVAGSDIKLIITSTGYISGAGGKGADALSTTPVNGGTGGDGMFVTGSGLTYRVQNDGYIAGGGGGGGSSTQNAGPGGTVYGAGDGGAGRPVGQGGAALQDGGAIDYNGIDGTFTLGGDNAGPGGKGGDLGQSGAAGATGNSNGQGGGYGRSIVGHSLITGGVTGTGTLYGLWTG